MLFRALVLADTSPAFPRPLGVLKMLRGCDTESCAHPGGCQESVRLPFGPRGISFTLRFSNIPIYGFSKSVFSPNLGLEMIMWEKSQRACCCSLVWGCDLAVPRCQRLFSGAPSPGSRCSHPLFIPIRAPHSLLESSRAALLDPSRVQMMF